MTIINLDPEFKPFGEGVPYYRSSFPSGCEPHLRMPWIANDKVLLTSRITKAEDVIYLMLASDAVKRLGVKDIEVFIPYLPFARQDRVMVPGEPLSVKVMADMINSQGFSKVHLFDVHSDVSTALINNVHHYSNYRFVSKCLQDKVGYSIVSPDAGAYKKVFSLCSFLGYGKEIIQCGKIRDVLTGRIEKISCNTDRVDGDVFIIDDICDGGATFVMIAKELKSKGCGSVNLIVSHGILSKGARLDTVDHIYTTNSLKNVQPSKTLTVHSLNKSTLHEHN